MLYKTMILPLLASSALALSIATPALADKADHAREAVSAAEAKVQTAQSLNVGGASPGEMNQALALVANAKEDFKSHNDEAAIREANQASAFADTAIAMAQQRRDEALASAHASQRATADAAKDEIAAAQGQAAAAQDQAVTAQQQAAEANARADAASQSAQASASDAAAAREAAAMSAARTASAAQVQTTVTTQQASNTRHSLRRRVIHSTTTSAAAPVSTDEVTTTTKVTPQ